MSLTMHKHTAGIGNGHMKQLNVLVEATVQGVKIRGAITCQARDEEAAKNLACQTFITQLRRAGVWSHTDVIDEPYEIEVEGPKDKKSGKSTKKKETKYKKITQYHAPYWNNIKVIDIIELNSRDLTFSPGELEEAARYENGGILGTIKKRRTPNQAALAKRNQKQSTLAKKEKQLEKKKKAESNKQSKEELLRSVEEYFTGNTPKIIKNATNELAQTYQRVRYALFQIKDNGYNGVKYELIQTEIDGSKAFRLVKEEK